MGCLCWNTTEPKIGEKLPAPKLAGRTANKLVQVVFELLNSNDHGRHNNLCTLLVHGMAGVGKTAIMMNVYNQLLESQANPYEKLIWVSGPHVPLDEDEYIRKLQKNMASAINFHLPNELDINKRTKLLCKAFECFGNYLLFLDGIGISMRLLLDYFYDYLDFNRVVVISRTYFAIAIGSMEFLHMRNVDLLSEKEACELFVNKIGIEVTLGMEDIAKEVVKECVGLPLTIVTIAEALKGKEERIWRETAQKLRCCITGMMDTRGTLYKSLNYQWEHSSYRGRWRNKIFFCVLYPKDWIISIKELWNYVVVVRFPGEYLMLGSFEEPFLLEISDVNFDDCHEWGEGFKMHPLYREFVLLISS